MVKAVHVRQLPLCMTFCVSLYAFSVSLSNVFLSFVEFSMSFPYMYCVPLQVFYHVKKKPDIFQYVYLSFWLHESMRVCMQPNAQ